ncbi:hypothetical protein UUU_35510 [Klebsiella pneumoniae subsp. pneumoniae DSM 30104 = JCM 1662 = NBRC 14940]|nr:hypothetical protein UUU_35510 [Klebsiella pneumoniae subsp. pneumoniae DSM 30104 = JCM 1662 = NBRC 14940]
MTTFRQLIIYAPGLYNVSLLIQQQYSSSFLSMPFFDLMH